MKRALAALLAASLCGPAQAGSSLPPYTPPHYAQPLRPLCARMGAPGGPSTSTVSSDGTSTGATTRMLCSVPAGAGGDGIVACFANWYITGTGETDGFNPINVKAGFVSGGTNYHFTFLGQQTVAIQVGGQVCSDPLGLAVPGGSSTELKVFVSVASGGKWPISRVLNSANAEGTNANVTAGATGTDLSYATGNMAGNTATVQAYMPLAVLARPFNASQKAVGILGDSIAAGYKDTVDANGLIGLAEKGLGLGTAFITNTKSSTTLADYVAGHSRRMTIFPQHITSLICELGSNDIFGNSSTLASIQALMLTTWGEFAARGIPVWQTTITPRTTSTDNWATTANQSVYNTTMETVRVGLNTWLRAGAPIVAGVGVAPGTAGAITIGAAGHPLTGVFDVTAKIETALNSSIMRTDLGAPSNDGTHFLAAVTPTMGTAINTALLQ